MADNFAPPRLRVSLDQPDYLLLGPPKMRGAIVFSGSSHPALVDGICDRLGSRRGQASLGKFANGETSVTIHTSIREKDVFIVQSGSQKINDSVIELLIMISACKGSSAKSITAVMPYFPYSPQSKKKQHRGAITARMVANLLHIAGVNHVITLDLHASQMQGFFKCPVDNLIAEPLLARWIKLNVPNWPEAVVVSKNPGGTKRVTSLADALKLSFGIVTTDRRRAGTAVMNENAAEQVTLDGVYEAPVVEVDAGHINPLANLSQTKPRPHNRVRRSQGGAESSGSPLSKSVRVNSVTESEVPVEQVKEQVQTNGTLERSEESVEESAIAKEAGAADADDEAEEAEYNDERARNVIHGRLVQGHIVDESHPSPALSATSNSAYRGRPPSEAEDEHIPEHMISSFVSTSSSVRHNRESEHTHALGGTIDAAASSEDEEDDLRVPGLETMVTLVGNVKGRPVFLVDDMIDKSASWIAAAETVVKRGGATSVYCMATHGLFGGDCLEELAACECIDKIVVTNSFPVPIEKQAQARGKLVMIGIDNLLAEAIRRNHHGESISQLFNHFD